MVPCPSPPRSCPRPEREAPPHREEIVVPDHLQPEEADPELQALRSPNASTRIQALHRICPCRAPWATYERYMDEARLLRKDPNQSVRKVALHLDEDAGGI